MEMGRNAGGGKPLKRHLAGWVIGVIGVCLWPLPWTSCFESP